MRALVLSGGGVKGAYQVGVLKRWMIEQRLDYDILCGVSVGALNVGFLAQFPNGAGVLAAQNLHEIWGSVTTDRVLKPWRFFGKVASLWKPSVYNTQPLLDWVRANIDVENVRTSGRIVRVGAVSWDTGEYGFGTETDPDFQKWVVASASYPVFMLPIEIGGKLWTDGGIRNVTPLGTAIRLGATDIDVVMCSNPDNASPYEAEGKAAIPSLAIRTMDLMNDQIMRADLQVCGLKNDLAVLGGPYRQVRVRLLQPPRVLADDPLDFNPAAIERMIEQGYADACALG